MSFGIIGRQEEQQTLKGIVQSHRTHFVAVYGRRRVGKTYLIHHFFYKVNAVFMTVTGLKDGAMSDQLALFRKSLQKTFYPDIKLAKFTSWLEAFEQLERAIQATHRNKRIILFFDEMPWLATKRSGFIQALDHYWNVYWSKREKLTLIACGSAASWMLDNLINAKGGLYNRVTDKILLESYSLEEAHNYLKHIGVPRNKKQTLELYMVLGGIPHYLNGVKRSYSVRQNINMLCFNKRGLLFDEFERLFRSLFETPEAHYEIVQKLSQSRQGLTQEALIKGSALLSSGGQLTKWLDGLIHAGFVEKYTPYLHRSRNVLYRLIDEYSLFYLTWIAPQKRFFEETRSANNYWEKLANSPRFKSWSGYAFESICYKHVDQIKKALGLDNILCYANVWRYQPRSEAREGAQIDLLFDREDGVINLCEIKYHDKPFVIDKVYYEKLQRRVQIFKEQTGTKKECHVTFITVNGVKENKYYHRLVDNQVTLEDFFQS